MELDSTDVNDAFIKAVRTARNSGHVAGGWITVLAEPPERRIDGEHGPSDEEAFMARYGYANVWSDTAGESVDDVSAEGAPGSQKGGE